MKKLPFTLSRKQFFLTVFLFLTVLGIQTIKIERPYLGHFSSYQGGVLASMARNILREDFKEVLKPKTDLLINGKRSMHLNQYPFPSLIAAGCIKLFGGSFEFWGRIQAIFFNLLSIVLIGLIAGILAGSLTGWIAACLFAFSPFSLIYGQAFLSESMALFGFLLSFFLILRWNQRPEKQFLLWISALNLSIALTGRIHFVLFCPIFLLFLFPAGFRFWRFFFYSALSFALPLAWHLYTFWVGKHSDNVMTSIFLQVGVWKLSDGNFLTQPEYYRHVLDIISYDMLTPLAFPFLFLGLLQIPKKDKLFFVLALGFFAGLVNIFLSPQKIMEQDFYLYGFFPFVIWTAAYGISCLWKVYPNLYRSWVVGGLLVVYLVISTRYFLHPIFKYPDADRSVIPTANYVKERTLVTDRIIVAGDGPADLLYYIDRPAWSIEFTQIGKGVPLYVDHPKFTLWAETSRNALAKATNDPVTWFEYLKKEGAEYLVCLHKEELQAIPSLYQHLEQNFKRLSSDKDSFAFYKLT